MFTIYFVNLTYLVDYNLLFGLSNQLKCVVDPTLFLVYLTMCKIPIMLQIYYKYLIPIIRQTKSMYHMYMLGMFTLYYISK